MVVGRRKEKLRMGLDMPDIITNYKYEVMENRIFINKIESIMYIFFSKYNIIYRYN